MPGDRRPPAATDPRRPLRMGVFASAGSRQEERSRRTARLVQISSCLVYACPSEDRDRAEFAPELQSCIPNNDFILSENSIGASTRIRSHVRRGRSVGRTAAYSGRVCADRSRVIAVAGRIRDPVEDRLPANYVRWCDCISRSKALRRRDSPSESFQAVSRRRVPVPSPPRLNDRS